MLSNVDIIKELGENIAILPFCKDMIKGNNINLRTSDLAWSIRTKTTAIAEDGSGKYIKLLPHDTTLIETFESIAVTDVIAGTCHSRVPVTSMGTGHIGTVLNPNWIGRLLIAIHNHTDEDKRLEIGKPFVAVVFQYLNTKSTYPAENKPSRVDMLIKYGIKITDEEHEGVHQKQKYRSPILMFEEMKKEEDYIEVKKEEEEAKKEEENKKVKNKSRNKRILLISIFALLGFGLLLCIVLLDDKSLFSKISIGALGGYIGLIGSFILNKIK